MKKGKAKLKRQDFKLPESAADLKWYTFEEVLAEAMKKKGFKEAYERERRRRDLADQIRTSRTAKKL